MKYIYVTLRALVVGMIIINVNAYANQAPVQAPQKSKVASLENLAARALAPKIINTIAPQVPTAERTMSQLKKLNIPQTAYAPVIYQVLHQFAMSPNTTSAEKRTTIMELLPLVLRYSSSPIGTLPLLNNAITSLAALPYDSAVGPWFMNLMQQISRFVTRPQNDAKHTILTFIFAKNMWTRADKLDFIARVEQWINKKEAQEAAQSEEASRTKKPVAVLGTSSKNILRMLKEVIADDESGSTSFDWSTRLAFSQTDFSYPVFTVTMANDPVALNALVKASGPQALEAINFMNGEDMNALAFAARTDGLLAITQALLRNGATITASFVSPDDNQEYVIYDALAEATERNDVPKVTAMLTLASDRIDDDILENALEIAITNNHSELMDILREEIRARQQQQ